MLILEFVCVRGGGCAVYRWGLRVNILSVVVDLNSLLLHSNVSSIHAWYPVGSIHDGIVGIGALTGSGSVGTMASTGRSALASVAILRCADIVMSRVDVGDRCGLVESPSTCRWVCVFVSCGHWAGMRYRGGKIAAEREQRAGRRKGIGAGVAAAPPSH